MRKTCVVLHKVIITFSHLIADFVAVCINKLTEFLCDIPEMNVNIMEKAKMQQNTI